MAADVGPRLSGLIPHWLLLAAVAGWFALFCLTRFPLRKRFRTLYLDIVALGALLLANLLFFWRPLLTSSQVPRGGGDLNSYFFPLGAFSASALRHGHIPLWNPSLFGGMPQLANYQAAMLYPPNVIAWLIHQPYTYGTLELLAIGHYFVAALGVYVLARSLAMYRFPATTAAIVFSASGFLTAHLGHYSMLSVAAWLPWLLLTLRKTALTNNWLWACATALVVFLAATGGHQQMLLYELTAGGIWWLYWVGERHELLPGLEGGASAEAFWAAVQRQWRSIGFDAFRAGGGLVAGLAMAAPMILPSLQMASLSVRSGLSYEQASEFSVEPIALLQFVLPKAFGSNPTDYWGSFSSGEVWAYVGVVTLVFAAIGLLVQPGRVRLLLAGFALVALIFALGPWTPLHGWVYRFVPPYNLIRAPARGYVFVDLSLALLAGFGLQEISYGAAQERLQLVVRQSIRWLLIGLAALILFVIPLFYSLILGTNDPSNRPVIAVDGLNLMVIYLLAVVALLWGVSRGKVGDAAACLLATSLIVLDLFGATATFNPGTGDLTAGYRHPQAVAFLRQQMVQAGPFRIASTTLAWQPDVATVAGLQDAGGLFDPMQPGNYKKVSDALSGSQYQALDNLLNVRYLITDAKSGAPLPAFSEVLRTSDGLVVWENHTVLPRARLVYSATSATVDEALAAVTSPGFDPSSTLYLSGDLTAAKAGGTGTATVTDYEDDRVSIRVQSDRQAYLVLADTSFPGWTAAVDGQQTSIATADGIFRAIAVPAGNHAVEFDYRPSIVNRSVVIALAGLGLLGLGLMLGFDQWRRARGQSRLSRARGDF